MTRTSRKRRANRRELTHLKSGTTSPRFPTEASRTRRRRLEAVARHPWRALVSRGCSPTAAPRPRHRPRGPLPRSRRRSGAAGPLPTWASMALPHPPRLRPRNLPALAPKIGRGAGPFRALRRLSLVVGVAGSLKGWGCPEESKKPEWLRFTPCPWERPRAGAARERFGPSGHPEPVDNLLMKC